MGGYWGPHRRRCCHAPLSDRDTPTARRGRASRDPVSAAIGTSSGWSRRGSGTPRPHSPATACAGFANWSGAPTSWALPGSSIAATPIRDSLPCSPAMRDELREALGFSPPAAPRLSQAEPAAQDAFKKKPPRCRRALPDLTGRPGHHAVPHPLSLGARRRCPTDLPMISRSPYQYVQMVTFGAYRGGWPSGAPERARGQTPCPPVRRPLSRPTRGDGPAASSASRRVHRFALNEGNCWRGVQE